MPPNNLQSMELEIKINNRLSKVKLINRDKNKITVEVDHKTYEVDLCKVETNEYSVIHQGMSHNVEVIEGPSGKRFITNTYYKSFDIEIIDAETRYLASRNKDLPDQNSHIISTPMPGKVVRILVKSGDFVAAGETVIIVSAMKMESEYKVSKEVTIKKVLVKEGDTVSGNQPLIVIE
jgi:biotin carboxyl carrier protein